MADIETNGNAEIFDFMPSASTGSTRIIQRRLCLYESAQPR